MGATSSVAGCSFLSLETYKAGNNLFSRNTLKALKENLSCEKDNDHPGDYSPERFVQFQAAMASPAQLGRG